MVGHVDRRIADSLIVVFLILRYRSALRKHWGTFSPKWSTETVDCDSRLAKALAHDRTSWPCEMTATMVAP
jgi:hypothetical protein